MDEYQLSIFDFFREQAKQMRPDLKDGPENGAYIEKHGAVICHIMRPHYIGKKVVYDCSTVNHKWYRVGVLEKYIPYEGRWRSVIDIGKKDRILLTHYPGIEIYEVFPFYEYPERVKHWRSR